MPPSPPVSPPPPGPGGAAARAARAARVPGWPVAAVVIAYLLFSMTHLGGAYWDSDEGLNVMKGRLFGAGYPLYARIWSDQPPGYTVLLAIAFTFAGPSMAAARAVTFLHGLIALAAAALTARGLGGGRWAMPAAAAALALAPNFFWASRAAMIGLPALAWAALAMALTLRYVEHGRRGSLVLAGFALGASCWLKLIGVYLLAPIALAIWLRRRGERPRRRRGDGEPVPSALDDTGGLTRRDEVVRDATAFGAAFALPVLVMLVAFDARALLAQVVGTVVSARGAAPLDVTWNAGKLADWLIARDLGRPDWTFADHAWLLAPALAGLAVCLRRRRDAGIVVAAWLGLTLLALMWQNPLWPKHHFLALLVILAPLSGIGIEWAGATLWAWRRGRGADGEQRPARLHAAPAAAALLVAAALVPLPTAIRADRARIAAVPLKESGKLPSHSDSWLTLEPAIAFLRDHTRPGDWVVTDHAYAAFRADRLVPPELAVISSKRISTGALTAEDVIRVTQDAHAAAVLFWDGDRLSDAFPAFADWVGWNYRAVAGAPAGWALWVRKGGP